MEDQKSRSRSPSPPPAEEAEQRSDKAAVPQEDAASLSGSDKHSDKDVNVAAEDSLAEATEKDESHDEEPIERSEQVPPKADAPVEEETKEEEKVEEKDERPAEATPPPPAEQESDLEAEYDNVEFDAERAAGAHQVVFVHSLPRSSGDSHSSHGSDTAGTTDSHTQSPMSTSPTPPPSLEPAPAPEPVRSSPSPKSSTTTKTTTTTNATSNKTNNASPKPVSNNNNSYNSSGLNLNMSAAEMRAKLASKKKADPRRDTVDLKKKYEIIQNM